MKVFAVIAALSLIAGPGPAVATEDPGWPCPQRRIDTLSLAQVWSGPVPDDEVKALAKSQHIKEMAQFLELRRTPMDEAEAMIANFADKATPQQMTALYVATFQRIDHARSAIIAGILRYAKKQQDLGARIDARRAEISRLMADPAPDFDRIDETEEQLDWDIRVFQDRQQSLAYVCETPVILEKRAFALGRAVMDRMGR